MEEVGLSAERAAKFADDVVRTRMWLGREGKVT